MQNTFSQSGNDFKYFLKKIIFQNRYVALETPPPPFMANAILNFHFDFLTTSLKENHKHIMALSLIAAPFPDDNEEDNDIMLLWE